MILISNYYSLYQICCTINLLINYDGPFFYNIITDTNAFSIGFFNQICTSASFFNEVCKMREIPEHRARESEIAFMEERKKVLNFSYNSMKQTYMPCRRIEEEEKENQRLKELYRASLLTAEDFQILQQNNEELKQVIAELEELFDKHQQEQEKQSSKQPEKIIIEDEGDIDETENIKQPKTPKKKQKK